jgi:hypothetical protein
LPLPEFFPVGHVIAIIKKTLLRNGKSPHYKPHYQNGNDPYILWAVTFSGALGHGLFVLLVNDNGVLLGCAF